MIHLHSHTKYSLLDSTNEIDNYLDRVKELGQTAAAITDHGNMYGVVEFYKAAIEKGIKPIIGCEVYVTEDINNMKRENSGRHLILLAKNETGRLNLQHLVSESSKYVFNKRPHINFDLLKNYHEGLICLSACMAGELSRAILNDQYDKAVTVINNYKELFNDDYYIEYQAHEDPKQQELNLKLVQLADKMGVKYVVTCDVHYLSPEEQKYHNIFVQIGSNREAGEIYNDCYVQSESEVLNKCISTYDYNVVAINNTHEIADKCNVDYPLSAPIIPHINIPKQFKNEVDYLKHLCNQGLKNKGFFDWDLNQWKKYMTEILDTGEVIEFVHVESVEQMRSLYKDRAKYELDAVTKMGFEGYYLLVHSYISSAKRRGIARGSAGGSLLAYLCGIVDIDPIKYGLYFERFIDVGALDLLATNQISRHELKIPDVDADFSTKDRDKVMQYIINTYGEENVVALGTFGYLRAKSAIKDIGKVLGLSFDLTNEMTKKLSDDTTIDDALTLGLLDEYKDEYPELFDYASHLANLPKSRGTHACGKIICMRNADYYNALEYDPNKNVWVLEGDMHTADDLGLVKIDLLGLRTLDVLYDVMDMVGLDYDFIAPHKIDLEDKLVWEQWEQGNSLLTFQFESPNMRKMLKDMQCNSINDLSAANALYRPGSKEYIPNYIARKKGLEEITYINDDLKPILANTYGIIVYQEQLIEIGRLAGLKNPDELRKATAKKKPKLMAKIEPQLKDGLINLGWTQEQVDTLWNDILKFALYSFNKSHSSAYGLTAYITMYFKVHYPVEYITASINSYDGKTEDIIEVIKEAQRMNVKCVYDKWCYIESETTCRDGIVYLGINTIKGLGKSISDDFKLLRDNTYLNFMSLLADINDKTSCNSRQLDILIKLNFFEEFGEVNTLLKQVEMFNAIYGKKQFNKEKLADFMQNYIMAKHCKETPKQYRCEDSIALLEDITNNYEYPKTSIIDHIKYEQEFLGYINLTIPSLPDEYAFVADINDNMYTLYYLNSGETCKIKCRAYTRKSTPCMAGDIIKILEITDEKKWRPLKDENGNNVVDENGKIQFYQIDERELILKKYSIVKT